MKIKFFLYEFRKFQPLTIQEYQFLIVFDLMSIKDKMMKTKCSRKGIAFDGTIKKSLGNVDTRNITNFGLDKQQFMTFKKQK